MKDMTTRGTIADVIIVNGKLFNERKAIDRFFYEATHIAVKQTTPCQAFINARKILEKIIKKGLGHQMPKKFLLNTKCTGGIPAERCLKACMEQLILTETGERMRIRAGIYDKIESFVKHGSIGAKVKNMLDDICIDRNIGCQHATV